MEGNPLLKGTPLSHCAGQLPSNQEENAATTASITYRPVSAMGRRSRRAGRERISMQRVSAAMRTIELMAVPGMRVTFERVRKGHEHSVPASGASG